MSLKCHWMFKKVCEPWNKLLLMSSDKWTITVSLDSGFEMGLSARCEYHQCSVMCNCHIYICCWCREVTGSTLSYWMHVFLIRKSGLDIDIIICKCICSCVLVTNYIFWCFDSAENVSKSDWSSAPSWTDMFILWWLRQSVCKLHFKMAYVHSLWMSQHSYLDHSQLTLALCVFVGMWSVHSIMKVHVRWVGRGNIARIWAMCLKKFRYRPIQKVWSWV